MQFADAHQFAYCVRYSTGRPFNLGLAIGLGVGIPLFVILVVCCIVLVVVCLRKKQRRYPNIERERPNRKMPTVSELDRRVGRRSGFNNLS